MTYKKIKNKNNTIHVIDSNRFKEMHIAIYFTKKANNDEMALGNLLCPNMTYTCKKYNTKSKIAIRGEELFGAKVSTSFGYNGNSQSYVVGLQMLNPKYTAEEYLDESLDFLYEILFNPNVDEEGFNETFFNITKNDYINSIKSIKENPNEIGSILYDRIIFKGTLLEKCIPSIEEIEKISRKDLYEYYKKLFDGSYNINIIIHGEDAESIVDKLSNRFKDIKGNNEEITFDIKRPFTDEVIEKSESYSFKQSRLYIGYSLKDLNYHERKHVLRVYNLILGSMTDSLLFDNVREKYSLCYSINSSFNRYTPVLTVSAGINKNNFEEAKKRIFETVELMKDKSIIDKYITQAKETFNTYTNSFYDDIFSQINHYFYEEFNFAEDVEELRDNINKVTSDEVIELSKKLYLNVIFFMRGDE